MVQVVDYWGSSSANASAATVNTYNEYAPPMGMDQNQSVSAAYVDRTVACSNSWRSDLGVYLVGGTDYRFRHRILRMCTTSILFSCHQ